MIIISDSSPLIALLKSNCINILHELYGEVFVPPKVYEEVTGNSSYKNEAIVFKGLDFIKISEIDLTTYADKIQTDTFLDRGESESIALAKLCEDSALLIIDEKKGRSVAKSLGIDITGSIGVIYAAFQSGYLNTDEVFEIIEIIKNTSLRISDKLIDDLKNKIIDRDKSQEKSR